MPLTSWRANSLPRIRSSREITALSPIRRAHSRPCLPRRTIRLGAWPVLRQRGRPLQPSVDGRGHVLRSLAWHYGYKAGWDATWQSWFNAKRRGSQMLGIVCRATPRRGLVTHWTTPGHIGANGIAETTGPCVMWGFHDSYGFRRRRSGDFGPRLQRCPRPGRHVRPCLDSASAKTWSTTADCDARRRSEPSSTRPDTCRGASANGPVADDGLARHHRLCRLVGDSHRRLKPTPLPIGLRRRYEADKAAGGTADLFNMTPGLRGAVRMASKADDVHPGSAHCLAAHDRTALGEPCLRLQRLPGRRLLVLHESRSRRRPSGASIRPKPRNGLPTPTPTLAAADGNHPYERIDGTSQSTTPLQRFSWGRCSEWGCLATL